MVEFRVEYLSFVSLPVHPAERAGYRAAAEVVGRLRGAGHLAYMVGGGVRDLVLGLPPKDFDIVTSSPPEETQRLFRRSIPVGVQFGVVTVVHRGRTFEVATFRAEGDYRDGRRPGWVNFADLEADLARRDFTINGLVLDPEEERILDFCGGLADLRRGVVRTIGEPGVRFAEDALRMLRAVRFAARFGFRLDRAARRAIVAAARSIGRVAAERIWQELEAMWSHPTRSAALVLLKETGLLEIVVPHVGALASGRGPWGPWARTVRRVRALPPDAPNEVAWACLFADALCQKEPATDQWDEDGPYDPSAVREAEIIMADLRAPRKLSRTVGELLSRRWTWHRAHEMRYGSLARLLRRDPEGHLLLFWRADAASFGRAEAARPLEDIAARLRARGQMQDGPNQPPITGDDLLARGLVAGPRFQELLAEAEREWLEGRLATREEVNLWLSKAKSAL